MLCNVTAELISHLRRIAHPSLPRRASASEPSCLGASPKPSEPAHIAATGLPSAWLPIARGSSGPSAQRVAARPSASAVASFTPGHRLGHRRYRPAGQPLAADRDHRSHPLAGPRIAPPSQVSLAAQTTSTVDLIHLPFQNFFGFNP